MTIDEARDAARHFSANVQQVRPFGSGHINETYVADAPHGELVLQRLNPHVFPAPERISDNVIAVWSHLRGRFVPEPIAAGDGRYLVQLASGSWRAWSRVPAAATIASADAHTARSAGALLGRLHAALESFDPARLHVTLPRFHDPRRRYDAFEKAVERDVAQRAHAAAREIDELRSYASLVDATEAALAAMPLRAAHNDAKLDNVLFRGDDAVCIVDLDTVMPGSWLWDVGDLLRTAAATAAEDDPAARVDATLHTAVLTGYHEGAQDAMTAAEAEGIAIAGRAVTFEQAARFLTDWLDGDVYYRTSRAAQNLDRARAQLGVLRTMPTTLPWS